MNNTYLKLVFNQHEQHHRTEVKDRTVDATSIAPERWVPTELIAEHLSFTLLRIPGMARKGEIPGQPIGTDVVGTLREGVNKSCQKIGSSLRHDGVGNIFGMKPTEDVLREDKGLLLEQDLKDSNKPDTLVRGIGLSYKAELVRTASKEWIPFGFVLILITKKHGRALHVGFFESATSIPGVDGLMKQKVMELALA